MPHRLVVEEFPDGCVGVSLHRDGQTLSELSGAGVVLATPFDAAAREDLRWYLEDYLIAPYAVYEERGQRVQAGLRGWGEALFEAVLGAGKPGHVAYIKAREAEAAELAVVSRTPGFMSLPWELLKDPKRQTPLALELNSFDRMVVAEGAATAVPPGKGLRVLMVIARPAGLQDVGYQMIARPLLERLAAVGGEVRLEVLRPPTLEALTARLAEAVSDGEPFHMLHFDGHGTFGRKPAAGGGGSAQFQANAAQGYLSFEAEGGGDHLVSAGEFAGVVRQGKVPLVVLNACRSGMLGEAAAEVEAAVASRLLEGGTASVVAMGYSVYAVAAAEFMAAFYEALFAGQSVSEAVTAGRQRMSRNKGRPSPKGDLPLEDWSVPVHYQRRVMRFQGLQHMRAKGAPSLDAMLNKLRPAGAAELPAPDTAETLAPVGRFVGRDAAFYTLERALRLQQVVVVHGPAGTGKTELAKAFGRWWQLTGGVENPDWVFVHSFEPGLSSFGLDGVVTGIGLRLFGADFVGRTRDAAQRRAVVLELLRERRMLLIWDNFESVWTLPDPPGATPPLDSDGRKQVQDFLAEVARAGRSGVVITSRTEEDWLGPVRRVELGGLSGTEAAAMATDVLAPYPAGQARRKERAFAELMQWLEGHPLSLRLLLPQLEEVPPQALLAALKGNTQNLPEGFVGEGRLASLGASLKSSLDHLPQDMQARLPALALFEGVADEDVLGAFSTVQAVPACFAEVAEQDWAAMLAKLAQVGLLTELGGGMYGLHPALPAYLAAQWRARAGEGFGAERAAAERALLTAYAMFGEWLHRQIQGGAAETAFALIGWQRRTMGRLLRVALEQGMHGEAQQMLQPLNEFWDARGLWVEARGWVDRVRTTLEPADGSPLDFETQAGSLWLFAVGSEASRALNAGDLYNADETYDAIRVQLEASSGPNRDRHLATSYHQLGAVAQDRGNLDAAEAWYRKSLEIKEALGNRPGLASSYHQLGIVAQLRGNLFAAEAWYRKSLEIRRALEDRPGLSASYHQLGMVAQLGGDLAAAEAWYRKSLEIEEALGNRPGLAGSYHQLGIVAQDRGDLAAAEAWYRKSLKIEEALGDQPGLALSYGQLGLLAEVRLEPEAALDWIVRCVAVFLPEFPHPATGPGPRHLARLTGLLGISALEASWHRCTGTALPAHVRSVIEQGITDGTKQ